ncbi:hypothetical protein GCM10027597_05300 [Saccharopolyspora tripterygii]
MNQVREMLASDRKALLDGIQLGLDGHFRRDELHAKRRVELPLAKVAAARARRRNARSRSFSEGDRPDARLR